jgi:hypothetical protein
LISLLSSRSVSIYFYFPLSGLKSIRVYRIPFLVYFFSKSFPSFLFIVIIDLIVLSGRFLILSTYLGECRDLEFRSTFSHLISDYHFLFELFLLNISLCWSGSTILRLHSYWSRNYSCFLYVLVCVIDRLHCRLVSFRIEIDWGYWFVKVGRLFRFLFFALVTAINSCEHK